jgi:uncharacterized protein
MTDADETTVTRDDEKSRYEILVGGEVAGFAAFRPDDSGNTVITHTEVDRAYAGRGLGSALASEALGDLARRGEVVVPACPFIAAYLKENEIAGLIVSWPDEADAADSATPGEQSS